MLKIAAAVVAAVVVSVATKAITNETEKHNPFLSEVTKNMKSNNLEEEFVKKFIIKNKQERILWELRSSKKRESVFWRFAGTEILKKECLNDLGYMPQKELEGYLLKYVRSRCVYFIGNDFIGEISLEEAVAQMEMGSIGIIYCGDGIGYYQGEQGINGHTPRCLLKENNVQM